MSTVDRESLPIGVSRTFGSRMKLDARLGCGALRSVAKVLRHPGICCQTIFSPDKKISTLLIREEQAKTAKLAGGAPALLELRMNYRNLLNEFQVQCFGTLFF